MDNIRELCEELGQNFLDFSYEANSQRAFADARDGLKPGQRACLWEMFSKGYLSSKPHVKSAKISGGVIASWWPHGDSAIYDTFTRMSQPWINNMPEVEWHGANGNPIIGPEAAAARYTEARLAKIVEEGMFAGIKKNNVPMIKNFSEDDEWPSVLPAVLPRLLINGCQGIGSTIANVWLPHSLGDCAKLISKYLESGEVDYSELYPSFPSGGIIINKNEISEIYKTGKGSVVLRGKVDINKNSIIITELPYQVYVEPYIDSVKDLIIKEEITGIEEILNCSDKNGLKIEVVCSGSPNTVLNCLFAKTDLQKSYHANQWALVGKTPKLLNLEEYCKIYVAHNLECLTREFKFDLEKCEKRKHIIDGLLIALEDLDNVIALIKSSESSSAAEIDLMKKYGIDSEQAKAILAMRLSSLAKLEKIELETEKKELVEKIKYLNEMIGSETKLKGEINTRLNNLVGKYKSENKTAVMQVSKSTAEEKEIEFVDPEKCVVVLTEGGCIKRVPSSTFKVQKRNTKGIKNQDEITSTVIRTNTIDSLMIFTNQGNMYRLLVNDIPEGTNAAKGSYVSNLIEMKPYEQPRIIYSMYRNTEAEYVVFVTKNGLIKKTSLDEYIKTKKKSGIAAISLKENDEIASVFLAKDEDIIISSALGNTIKFNLNEVSATGRATSGVKAMTLEDGDAISTAMPIHDNNDDYAIFLGSGIGKRVKLEEFPLQKRGGKGLKSVKIDGKDYIAAAALVNDNDNILVIGQTNSVCISGADLSVLSRSSTGTCIIKNNKIISVSKV